MTKLLKFAILAVVLLATASAYAADADEAIQKTFQRLMDATVSNDYHGFMDQCDAIMKAAMTKEMLQGLSEQIQPRAKTGYDAQYFGEVDEQGYKMYVWRLRFKDGGDEILATMSMKDGKVGGFYLR